MENHTYTAINYKEQIQFLESIYNEERAFQQEEDRKKLEALYGAHQPPKIEEAKVSASLLGGKKILTYKNRIQRQIELEGEDQVDREDHVIQLPWQIVEAPTDEEIKKRHEMRKEQGQKLKEIMQRKREEKKRKMEEELADLQSLESLREQNDMQGFKEELQHRSISNYEEYKKRVKLLQVKLGLKVAEPQKTDEEKFNLIDTPDEFLSPEQLK